MNLTARADAAIIGLIGTGDMGAAIGGALRRPLAAETRASLPFHRSLDEAIAVFTAVLDRAPAREGPQA